MDDIFTLTVGREERKDDETRNRSLRRFVGCRCRQRASVRPVDDDDSFGLLMSSFGDRLLPLDRCRRRCRRRRRSTGSFPEFFG